MYKSLSPQSRTALSYVIVLCWQVVRALTDLKIIVSRGDDLSLRRAITYFLDNIARQTKEQETIAAIGEDIFAVALDQPFRCWYIMSVC